MSEVLWLRVRATLRALDYGENMPERRILDA